MSNNNINILFVSFNQKSVDVLVGELRKSIDLTIVGEIYDDPSGEDRDFFSADLHSLRLGCTENHNFSVTTGCVLNESVKNEARQMSAMMLTRQGVYDGSISFEFRSAYFEKMWNFYVSLLKCLKVDVVIYRNIPHFASEYILSKVGEALGVMCISKEDIYPIKSSFLINLAHRDRLCYFYPPKPTTKVNRNKAVQLIDKFVSENSNPTSIQVPSYYRHNLSVSEDAKSIKGFVKEFVGGLVRTILSFNRENYVTLTSFGKHDTKLREHRSEFSWRLSRLIARRQIRKNEKAYLSLCIDNKKKYNVLITPNYQPERTTLPDCGLYGDLLTFVGKVNQLLPKDVSVGFKDHSSVFNPPAQHFYRGHLYRSRFIYTSIKELNGRIGFISTQNNLLPYLANCDLLFAQSSTAAYQASLLGKKVIIFGYSWFSECKAVLRYDDDKSALAYIESECSGKENIRFWTEYLNDFIPYIFKMDVLRDVCSRNHAGYIDQLVNCLNNELLNRAKQT